ncbi:hypothetical protein B0H10DRAFT_252171 [Mycena sp. CBHHK59/15]|nr:hypothetical protein B0H10DRAFT_252171 [Mycena sp. CBHHK59/15]
MSLKPFISPVYSHRIICNILFLCAVILLPRHHADFLQPALMLMRWLPHSPFTEQFLLKLIPIFHLPRWFGSLAHDSPRHTTLRLLQTRSSTTFSISELREIILDHLHDNPVALSNSALVCRSWVRPSRYHLYHSVLLSQTNCGLIHSLRLPHLAELVQSLIICFSNTDHIPLSHPLQSVQLHRLRQIELRGNTPASVLPFLQKTLSHPHISHITIFSPFKSSVQLANLLSKRTAYLPVLHLRLAEVLSDPTPDVVAQVIGKGSPFKLSGVGTLNFTVTDDGSSLIDLLQSYKQSISTLKLDGCWRSCNLAVGFHLPRLSSLVNVVFERVDVEASPALYQFLSTMNSVQTMSFRLTPTCSSISKSSTYFQMYWKKIDTLLDLQFPSLLVLRIEMPSKRCSHACQTDFALFFPALTAKGYLDLSYRS